MTDLYSLYLIEHDRAGVPAPTSRLAGPLPPIAAMEAARRAAPALPLFLFVPGRPPRQRPPYLLLVELLRVVGVMDQTAPEALN